MFEPKKAEGFDFHLFRVKPEVGRRLPPVSDMYSNVARAKRCNEKWKKSGLSWLEWRKKEETDYVAQIRDRVKNELVIGLRAL